uniref:ATP synthase F0 subunit 6 n=1 Tax=Kathetostoma albigutta TaxID=348052 RepID=UPI0028D3936D|nr:ATP synthase F0 subunit 6 [Kathetostoma albigutta]WMY90102.1 ATP synthase F0 subunit 6 [Kathetostoma albigutta]
MTMSLFDQFAPPTTFGVSLLFLALSLPWVLVFSPSNHWLGDRISASKNWLIKGFVRQLFMPINLAGHKWALLLTSLMLFLITLNMLGLLPYTFTPTTQLSLNLGLAVPLWLATVLIGWRSQPNVVLAHFLPEGTPTLLTPVLIIIETISLFIRPLALGVRLTANLTAGHLLIQLTSMATYALLTLFPPVAAITMTLLFLLTALEVAVAVIQAYVFVLLLSLYLQENV